MGYKIDTILEYFDDDQFVLLGDKYEFDKAIVGVDVNNMRIVYDVGLILECLVEQGMEADDAIQHYEYNMVRSLPYVENAPILMSSDFLEL